MIDMKIRVYLEEADVSKDFFDCKENNLKCPFCQQELRKIHPTYVICDSCRITGEDKLWQELIRTHKALEVAVDALKTIKYRNETYNRDDSPDCIDATLALDQITALEQKDVK